jgi:hypothetical protein
MTFDKKKTNTDYCHIDDDGNLVNKPAIEIRHPQRLGKYRGTCGYNLLPLPTSPSTVPPAPQYWEVHARVEWRGGLWGYVLELGVCGEGSLDREWCVHGQPDSWVMAAVDCDKHRAYCVTPYMEGERGECSLSLPLGSVTTLQYGVVVDVGRGKVGIVDLVNGKVVMKCSAKFTQTLVPVFGVGDPDFASIKMTLVSGGDIDMTTAKKSLIQNILSTT